jgi:hypothetical protein
MTNVEPKFLRRRESWSRCSGNVQLPKHFAGMSAGGNPILNKLFDVMMDPLRVVSRNLKTILLGSKEVLRGGAIGGPHVVTPTNKEAAVRALSGSVRLLSVSRASGEYFYARDVLGSVSEGASGDQVIGYFSALI